MPIKYQPLGIPSTSSFADIANGAITGSNLPTTASVATVTTDVTFTGPPGDAFASIITGSIVEYTP
jgi:hypothetical protein